MYNHIPFATLNKINNFISPNIQFKYDVFLTFKFLNCQNYQSFPLNFFL